jgi:hypothetical protein
MEPIIQLRIRDRENHPRNCKYRLFNYVAFPPYLFVNK